MTAEEALELLMSDVREYRDREQGRLTDTTLSITELTRTFGGVVALKNIEEVIRMLLELCGKQTENEGGFAACNSVGERVTAGGAS